MTKKPTKPATKTNLLARRSLLLLGAQAGFMGLLAWRMRQLGVDQAERYRMLAEENRINIRLISPARGLIYDRRGDILAQNLPNYKVTIVREQAGDVEKTLHNLSKLVPLSAEVIARVLSDMSKRSAFVPVTVLDDLTWQDIAAVSANAPALPGISTEVGLFRIYPKGEDFAHIVGYVGPVSDYDLSRIEKPDPLLQIPKFLIGKNGVEQRIDGKLRGIAGVRRIEVNSRGRVMRELDREEPAPGANLQLTVDNKLQKFAIERLGNQSGAAVVMDLHSGDLLAIASAPTFDPNKFVRGISLTDWNALIENEFRPLSNKSVSGTYPPGSTFKMVVALAGLEAGLLSPNERVHCPGFREIAGNKFHCWRRGGHGSVNLKNSLKYSCDVFYYEVASRVGIERITQMAKRLGLGFHYDLPLPAVRRGLTPTKAWKQEVKGANWVIGDTINAAIGQGFVLTSPLQLAVMAARIGSGKQILPRLVNTIDGVPTPLRGQEPLEIDPRHLDYVRRGMFAVSNETRGTAYRARITAKGQELAGKTGTSQVRRITKAERASGVIRNKDLPWARRDHALFVAFAPYKDPKFAISVIVEHGGGGSAVAAPIARDIMKFALQTAEPGYGVFPDQKRSQNPGPTKKPKQVRT